MFAIRLIGEDMKPGIRCLFTQNFCSDYWVGGYHILSSHYIAIPMRRTDRKMPSFSPDFDDAPLRHQLYTLALTHFQAVYINYFERAELHKLHNRSGELWS